MRADATYRLIGLSVTSNAAAPVIDKLIPIRARRAPLQARGKCVAMRRRDPELGQDPNRVQLRRRLHDMASTNCLNASSASLSNPTNA